MLFSDGKEKPKYKKPKEDTTVHGFFMEQSNIELSTKPINFDLGKPKYKNTNIDIKITEKGKKNGRFKKPRSGSLF